MSLDPLRRWEQRFGALPLPSPLVWALLVALFLGFGVLMGRAAGSDAVDSLAAERAPLKLLVAQAAASGASSTTGSKPRRNATTGASGNHPRTCAGAGGIPGCRSRKQNTLLVLGVHRWIERIPGVWQRHIESECLQAVLDQARVRGDAR